MKPINITQLAALTGFGRERVRSALADLMPMPISTNRKTVYDSTQALPRLYKIAQEEGEKDSDRYERIRADMLEVKLLALKEELIDVEEVRTLWDTIVGGLKTRLQQVAPKCESKFQPGMSATDIRKLAESEVDEALADLSTAVGTHKVNVNTDVVDTNLEVVDKESVDDDPV